MYNFILKLFVKDYQNTSDASVRERYGILSGTMGIICNLILFILKVSVGIIIKSVAVISDAFNNLSDLGSTVISLIGIKLSSRKPDRDHPFGHGRLEYISALIVSFLIMLVGFELFKSSFDKIIHPTEAEELNPLLIGLLALSLPVKLFMYGYNKHFGNAISSAPLVATALDSRNDCLATSAVIISAIVDGLHLLPFVIDGYVGALVAVLIMYAGFSVAKDTIGLLLGKSPDAETVRAIHDTLVELPEIIDIHDLIIHDYGPGRLFASVHCEVSDKEDIVAAHEAIDEVEQRIFNTLGCEITVHLDPISTGNKELERIRAEIKPYLEAKRIKLHDLRMTDGESHKNILFDILVPFEIEKDECDTVIAELKRKVKALDSRYDAKIQVDRDFAAIL